MSGSHSAYTPAPTMLAVNRTAGVDSQLVAFQPVLFKWSGSGWVQDSAGMVLYGTATDGHTPTTWYDLASHKAVGNGTTNLTLVGKGYWKVAFRMGGTRTPRPSRAPNTCGRRVTTRMSPIGAVTPASYCTT